MGSGPRPGPDPADESRRLWRLAGMGFTLASEIAAGALIGWLIDKLADTKPRWILICTIAGVVVGLATFLRQALAEGRKASREGQRIGASHAQRPSQPRTLEDDHDRDGESDDD